MALKRITFTGADTKTNQFEMLNISKEYPFVEWGILLPHIGVSRFPSKAWLTVLIGAATLAPFKVQLAGHLCPPWTGDYLNGDKRIFDLVGTAFQRIQINTHGEEYLWHEYWLEDIASDSGREYIVQLDGISDVHMHEAIESHAPDVTGLHDMSHGGGKVPKVWPKSNELWIGYAGGLGSHNLGEELPKIAKAAGDADYWIDMETYVRTNGEFDLQKCIDCIKIVEPFIVK
jgi:hypothetical protein